MMVTLAVLAGVVACGLGLYVWCACGDCGFPPPKVGPHTGTPREKAERSYWESGR